MATSSRRKPATAKTAAAAAKPKPRRVGKATVTVEAQPKPRRAVKAAAPAAAAPKVTRAARLRSERLRNLMRLIDERSPDHVALTGVRYSSPRERGAFLHR